MYIYKITNIINGNSYIGKTEREVALRYKEHLRNSGSGDYVLHRAIKKYGKENFTVETLATAETPEELNALESRFIAEFNTKNNGYNMTEGGDGKLLFNRELILEVFNTCGSYKETASIIGCCVNVVRDHLNSVGLGLSNTDSIKRSKGVAVTSIYGEYATISDAADYCVTQGFTPSKESARRKIQDVCAGRRKSVYNSHWNYCTVV